MKAVLQIRNSIKAVTQASWRFRLGYLGRLSDIQPTAHFEYPANISLGDRVCVARNTILRSNTHCSPGIQIGSDCHVGEYSVIAANRGKVVMGDNSWIGPHSVIHGNGGVRIGDNVMIASHCAISTVGHHHQSLDVPMSQQGVQCDPVLIEDDVWIGTGAVILKGVRIGRGSIVGAGAVVTRDVAPESIVTGVPARVTGHRRGEEHHGVIRNVQFARRS